MFRGKRHPGDEALIRRYMADRGIEALLPEDARVVRHVASCGACGRRYAHLAADLDDAGRLSAGTADAAFTAEHLAHQRERILRRIDQHGARVLPFPAADLGGRGPGQARPVLRWVAAAAAAGLVIGLSAGRLLNLRHESASPQVAARDAAPPVLVSARTTPVRPAAFTLQELDDVFVWDVESSPAPRTPELRAIYTLTLEARDTIPPAR